MQLNSASSAVANRSVTGDMLTSQYPKRLDFVKKGSMRVQIKRASNFVRSANRPQVAAGDTKLASQSCVSGPMFRSSLYYRPSATEFRQ